MQLYLEEADYPKPAAPKNYWHHLGVSKNEGHHSIAPISYTPRDREPLDRIPNFWKPSLADGMCSEGVQPPP